MCSFVAAAAAETGTVITTLQWARVMLQVFLELYFTFTSSLIASRAKIFNLVFFKNKNNKITKKLYLAEKNLNAEEHVFINVNLHLVNVN